MHKPRVGPSLNALAAMSLVQTIDKARSLIETGSHYEAQQMLKTVYHRQRARKQTADSYTILKARRVGLVKACMQCATYRYAITFSRLHL